MLEFPVVRYRAVHRIAARYFFGIVHYAGAVGDDSRFSADAFEAVPDQRWNGDQAIVVRPEKDFLDLAFGRAACTIIVEYKLDVAVGNGVVQDHALVQMPGLDGAWINAGKIDFAKGAEMDGIVPQHMHDLAALICNSPQRCYDHTVYHSASSE